jgi:hypothetical protein
VTAKAEVTPFFGVGEELATIHPEPGICCGSFMKAGQSEYSFRIQMEIRIAYIYLRCLFALEALLFAFSVLLHVSRGKHKYSFLAKPRRTSLKRFKPI